MPGNEADLKLTLVKYIITRPMANPLAQQDIPRHAEKLEENTETIHALLEKMVSEDTLAKVAFDNKTVYLLTPKAIGNEDSPFRKSIGQPPQNIKKYLREAQQLVLGNPKSSISTAGLQQSSNGFYGFHMIRSAATERSSEPNNQK